MKKCLVNMAILLLVGLLLNACSQHDSYTREAFVSNVRIMDKGEADDGQYWIMFAYPGKKKMKSIVKLKVEEKLWETIEIDQKYTVNYAKQEDGTYYLNEITLLKD